MDAVTKDEIEKALNYLAVLMANGEVAYLPLYERLEQELAKLESQGDALERARLRAAGISASASRVA